jgi:diguanylate cyclase (GGDEF)-like protein
VFRWGGDEFAVLVPGTPGEAATAVFERLEAAVADRVHDPDGAAVRDHVGRASTNSDTELDLRTLTERADAALRERKPAASR